MLAPFRFKTDPFGLAILILLQITTMVSKPHYAMPTHVRCVILGPRCDKNPKNTNTCHGSRTTTHFVSARAGA